MGPGFSTGDLLRRSALPLGTASQALRPATSALTFGHRSLGGAGRSPLPFPVTGEVGLSRSHDELPPRPGRAGPCRVGRPRTQACRRRGQPGGSGALAAGPGLGQVEAATASPHPRSGTCAESRAVGCPLRPGGGEGGGCQRHRSRRGSALRRPSRPGCGAVAMATGRTGRAGLCPGPPSPAARPGPPPVGRGTCVRPAASGAPPRSAPAEGPALEAAAEPAGEAGKGEGPVGRSGTRASRGQSAPSARGLGLWLWGVRNRSGVAHGRIFWTASGYGGLGGASHPSLRARCKMPPCRSYRCPKAVLTYYSLILFIRWTPSGIASPGELC